MGPWTPAPPHPPPMTEKRPYQMPVTSLLCLCEVSQEGSSPSLGSPGLHQVGSPSSTSHHTQGAGREAGATKVTV